jgi:glycolate oxidase iron-sulfur subunit
VELLSACGADVIIPQSQVCCGAIHHHNGAHESATALARSTIDAFDREAGDCEMIVTNIAGCGAMLREYEFLLRDSPNRDRASGFVAKVRDISEALLQLGLPPLGQALASTATYHDACHLAHAQRVTDAPRELLAMIPGLKLSALPESDMCCGAAGTYNLTEPEMATALADRKLDNIARTGVAMCVSANIGCTLHLRARARAHSMNLRFVHPVELIHQAIFRDSQSASPSRAER